MMLLLAVEEFLTHLEDYLPLKPDELPFCPPIHST
jgi:hypothetical protein